MSPSADRARNEPRPSTLPARPLVSCEQLLERLDDRSLVIVEVDEQPLLYRMRHIPGAHMLDWRLDLQDPITRDLPAAPEIERLWGRLGIDSEVTLVLYGDKYNLYACFAFWVFWAFGLRRMEILDGGRPLWLSRGLPMDSVNPPDGRCTAPAAGFDASCRAAWWHLRKAPAPTLVDVRTPEEYTGAVLAEPGYPAELAQRPGHIPGARNVPWTMATEHDGRLKPLDELERLYGTVGVTRERPVITYCRIGERSAHTWFVLHHLLRHPDVRNYDGSWTEWGSMTGMPIALGDEPGELPDRFPHTLGFTGAHW